jgi:bifunctional DNA-binding transcriptional regulator/antitoxin component of YhaV-PrlF toxin-antitoxin module
MSNVVMTKEGTICIPPEVRAKHGFTADTPIRMIETRTGILLIPLTNEPMSKELADELAEWQALSRSAWDMFPYEEKS